MSVAAQASESSFVPAADGLPLCVYETGNPAGRELLLIHGFSQSYAVFKRQFEGSLARDFRIVAFDLRGHGCSGKSWQESAYSSSQSWADDVATVIRERKLKRPLLVGWSYGGYINVDYVRHHGTAGIAGLVMVGSNAGLIALTPELRQQMAKTREVTRGMKPDVEAQVAAGKTFVSVMTAKPAPDDMRDIMFATNQMLPTYVRRLIASRSLENEDMPPKLTTPVLLLVGNKDGSQSVDALRALATRLPQGQITVMDGAGHAAFIDDPAGFDAEIRRFVTATALR